MLALIGRESPVSPRTVQSPARVPQAAWMSCPPEYAPNDRLGKLACQRIAESSVLIGSGGLPATCRIRHVDQVESYRCIADQIGQGAGIRLVDVDPVNAHIRQHHAIAPGHRVSPGGRHDLGDRDLRGQRYELGSLGISRRPQTNRQAKPTVLDGKAIDLPHEPDGTDRDRLRGDRSAEGTSKQFGGRHHTVVIEEWFAHPHENRPGHTPAFRAPPAREPE